MCGTMGTHYKKEASTPPSGGHGDASAEHLIQILPTQTLKHLHKCD